MVRAYDRQRDRWVALKRVRTGPEALAREFGALDLGVGQVLQGSDAHRLGGKDSNVSVSSILKESPPRELHRPGASPPREKAKTMP